MANPSDRIHERRIDLGMSQIDLAKELGYTDRSSIAKIEKGVNDITQSKIESFASALHTTAAYLMGWTNDPYDYSTDEDSRASEIPVEVFDHLMEIHNGNFRDVWRAWTEMKNPNTPQNIIPMPKMRRIPLLGTIACGTPITAEQNYDGDVDIPSNIRADFALRCKGDSMINARIYDGDICYIRRQSTVQSGQIAAVLIDDEATLKRVRLFDDHIVLEPENPTYRPIVFWNEEMSAVTILGLAVAFTSSIF